MQDEPTPDSRRRQVRRGALVSLAVVIVVLVLGEVAVRAFAPYLPEPELYADRSTQVKAAQLAAIERDRACVPVVFVGNSMVRDGVDPPVFTAADRSKRAAYNAALDAATPDLLRGWVPDRVLPDAHPDTVVIGLASFDLNDRSSAGRSAVDAYRRAPETRDDLMGKLDRPFIHAFDLWRHRAELRDPQTLLDSWRRWRRGEKAARTPEDQLPNLLGPQGQGLSRRELVLGPDSAVTDAFVREQLTNDFDLGGVETNHLQRLVDDLVDRGTQVVLVLMPVTDRFAALHPGGARDLDAFALAVQGVGEQRGVPVLDLRSWSPPGIADRDALFADTHHLNGDGATAFSAALADRLPAAPRGGCNPPS